MFKIIILCLFLPSCIVFAYDARVKCYLEMPVYHRQQDIKFPFTVVGKVSTDFYDFMKAEHELQWAACKYEQEHDEEINAILATYDSVLGRNEWQEAYLIKRSK